MTIFLLLIVICLCVAIYRAHRKHADALATINAEIAHLRLMVRGWRPASVSAIKPTVPPDNAA